MPTPIDMIEGSKVAEHRPWPRIVVREDAWRLAADQLHAGRLTLAGLWGDVTPAHSAVHLAVMDEEASAVAILSLECPDGRFPSVGALHPPAIRLERALRDLHGIEPVGLPDPRPWLDLGFWDVQHPLAARRS